LARSEDGGLNWSFLPDMLEPDLGILDIKVIDGAIYVIQSDEFVVHSRLTVSYDDGSTWQMADDGIPMDEAYTGIGNVIEVGDYLVCNTLGYRSGIYYSPKDDLQWRPFNEGLPYLGVKDLAYDGEFLYAASTGQGIWTRKAQELFLTSNEEPRYENGFSIYPNPASEHFRINLPGVESAEGTISIYDAQGRLVMEEKNSDQGVEISVNRLPDGMYLIELLTSTGMYSGKLIIQH
jgi:hypothetical protein